MSDLTPEQITMNKLRDKVNKELQAYLDELKLLPPSYIISQSPYTTMLQAIVSYIQSKDIDSFVEEDVFNELLEKPNTLDYICNEYMVSYPVKSYINTDIVKPLFDLLFDRQMQKHRERVANELNKIGILSKGDKK